MYGVGDLLHVTASMLEGRKAGPCKVLAVMPHEWRSPVRYRVQSQAEEFQRIVSETELSLPTH